MAMKRTTTPWMPGDAFGRSLARGVGINLIAPEIAPLADYLRGVLGAEILYADEDFAAIALNGSVMMLHADHAYEDNALRSVFSGAELRGAGVEIRVYGADPDACESRARSCGHDVLAGSVDKPHGLRECVLLAPFGYVFVPSKAI